MTGASNRFRRPPVPYRLPALIVSCAACGTELGRCADQATADRALLTHSAQCAKRKADR